MNITGRMEFLKCILCNLNAAFKSWYGISHNDWSRTINEHKISDRFLLPSSISHEILHYLKINVNKKCFLLYIFFNCSNYFEILFHLDTSCFNINKIFDRTSADWQAIMAEFYIQMHCKFHFSHIPG